MYANGKLTHEHLAEPNCFFNLNYVYNEKGVAGITAHNYSNNHSNEIFYTFRKNLFGDITEIYQGTTCVAKYKYDAWGNCTVCNPDGTVNTSENFIGNLNPFRYRGYYWDKHAQMYFLQTRWYDPTVCRFISPDSYEYLDPTTFGGLNLYAYCLNNPIMYSDPSGRSIIATFVILGIFTLVGGVVGGVKAYNNAIENSFSKKDLFCQTVLGTLVGASFGLAAGGVVVMLGAVGAGILSKTFLGLKR